MLAVLNQAEKDCGFSALLSKVTYPASGPLRVPGNPGDNNFKKRDDHDNSGYDPALAADFMPAPYCDFNEGTQTAAQVAFLVNNTGPPPCFGSCGVFDAANNYFLGDGVFNVYNVDELDYSTTYYDGAWKAYLGRADVQAAIHAPPGATFVACSDTIQKTLNTIETRQVPAAYDVIPRLLAQGVRVHISSGTLDYILPHLGNEVIIQNMTWGGAMGFKRAPTEPLRDHLGRRVGSGREERGLSYYKFDGAGHRVPQDAPAAALEWLKEVVVRSKGAWWWFWV